jgi:hypothetical protein
LEVYGEDHRETIREKMKTLESDGQEHAGGTLDKWRQCRLEMYMTADEDTKTSCEKKAAAFNADLSAPRDAEEIYACVMCMVPSASTDCG